MKASVIVFPGSNCDRDAAVALEAATGRAPAMVWHGDSELPASDLIVLPGGFSYGDYLRCGAIARFSPIMRAVIRAAKDGMPLIGICNGFQILCEAGLLPGALIRNQSLRFVCKPVWLRVESNRTPFTANLEIQRLLRMPVAHGEGSYFADETTLARIESKKLVVFRYTDEMGNVTPESNPNGSVHGIAGICNEARNILGMMPHPDRAWDRKLGSEDGKLLFTSLIETLEHAVAR
jgi:phosphoribosylformylglycinamidine synthase subunit PurQ / glutaminase